MAGDQRWQAIPTQLELAECEQFILPHLASGARGPEPKLGLHEILNYVLKHVQLGFQWKELPIDEDGAGRLETHYTRIYRIWRRWVDNGCIDPIFRWLGVAASSGRASSMRRLSTATAPRLRRKRAATTSASAGTRS